MAGTKSGTILTPEHIAEAKKEALHVLRSGPMIGQIIAIVRAAHRPVVIGTLIVGGAAVGHKFI